MSDAGTGIPAKGFDHHARNDQDLTHSQLQPVPELSLRYQNRDLERLTLPKVRVFRARQAQELELQASFGRAKVSRSQAGYA